MWKLLLFLIVAWLVFTLLKRQRTSMADTPSPEKTDDMVACALCAVHIPKAEAISSQDQFYCSEAHFLERNKDTTAP